MSRGLTATRRWAAGVCRGIAAVLAAVPVMATMPTPASAQYITFIRDTETEVLLNDYARPIFRAAGPSIGGSGRVAIRIVKSDVFNAFVLDGRNVFIHTGALLQSETPNQVIGVIAHETGHIVGGHIARLRDRIARDQTKCLLIQLLGVGLIFGGAGRDVSGAGTGVIAGGCELVERSMLAERRAEEAAADQYGLKALLATKQSGRGMLETFERFANQELLSTAGQDPFVRSHPVAMQRLAQLRDSVAKSPYYNVKDPPALQLRHDMMRAKLSGFCRPRLDVMRVYPATDTGIAARYARAIANSCSGDCSGRCPSVSRAGLDEIDALIKSDPKYPYFWELKAHVLISSGRQAEAIEPLRRAISLAPETNLMSVRLAGALLAIGGPQGIEEAMALVRKANVTDPSPEGYRILANAFAKKEQLPQAELAMAEAHFLAGDIKQAQTFAKRAQKGLKVGSPEALRATDIANYKTPS